MQANVMQLAKISAKMGLRISKSKTKVIRVKTRNVERVLVVVVPRHVCGKSVLQKVLASVVAKVAK